MRSGNRTYTRFAVKSHFPSQIVICNFVIIKTQLNHIATIKIRKMEKTFASKKNEIQNFLLCSKVSTEYACQSTCIRSQAVLRRRRHRWHCNRFRKMDRIKRGKVKIERFYSARASYSQRMYLLYMSWCRCLNAGHYKMLKSTRCDRRHRLIHTELLNSVHVHTHTHTILFFISSSIFPAK